MISVREEKYRLLREKAEQLLINEPERFKNPEQADLANLLHELAVFQAEIEMQNEELRQAQQQAEEARDQYIWLYENAPVGYLRLNEFGMILHYNRTFAEMIKSDGRRLINKPLVKLLRPEDRDLFYARYNSFFKEPSGKTLELHFMKPGGGTFVAGLTARRDLRSVATDAVQPSMLVIVSDITENWQNCREQEKAREELNFLARHDPLTGLPNRLMLSNHLSLAIERASRHGGMLALLLMDLDRFKDVNDSFGHSAGDELLRQVAKRITGRLRVMDNVSRLGGDEFTILLEEIEEPQDAAWVANDLIGLIHTPFQLETFGEVSVGASIGIALFPENAGSEHELLQQADAALYRAKAEGRGRFIFFTEALTLEARERIKLSARLRKAIEFNELRLFFQPQLDLKNGSIVGAEALVRWEHPELGMIHPANFIPVAEDTSLISLLGEWVLQEVCRQGAIWLANGLPRIRLAVNLSTQQLRYGDVAETISDILAKTAFPPELLEIEITESALMHHPEDAVKILKKISDLGVSLTIDDFGTGYSSLARIKQFPLQMLKIDQGFIADIFKNQKDKEIASTIVAMGQNLGFKVIAEGVESMEQLDFLKLLNCDMYQGFLACRPVPADEFALLLGDLEQLGK